MKTRTIKVTGQKLKQFVACLRSVPDSPVGQHLTEAQFLGYRLGLLSSEETNPIDQHLASCPECAAEMEYLQQESNAWRSKETKERLAAIKREARERFADETALDSKVHSAVQSGVGGAPEAPSKAPSVIPRQSTTSSLAEAAVSALEGAYGRFMELVVMPVISALVPKPALACGVGPKPVEVKTDDGSFGAHLAVLGNGDLSISLGSRETCLANQAVSIIGGGKRWVATFRRVAIRGQDQVVAELVIKHEELVAIPQGSVLRARLGKDN